MRTHLFHLQVKVLAAPHTLIFIFFLIFKLINILSSLFSSNFIHLLQTLVSRADFQWAAVRELLCYVIIPEPEAGHPGNGLAPASPRTCGGVRERPPFQPCPASQDEGLPVLDPSPDAQQGTPHHACRDAGGSLLAGTVGDRLSKDSRWAHGAARSFRLGEILT